MRTVWRARKVFKFPKIKCYFGKYKGNGYFEIDTLIFSLYSSDVLWKDKYDTPRIEFPPKINIVFFKFVQLHIILTSPIDKESEDEYYEQMIWYLDYSEKNIEKAIKTWPYTKWNDENKSTWNNKFLKQ